MYNQKFAAAIKVNGKVLREFKDEVYVPFASEYSILLKNLNTKNALVNVYIDGENQTPNGLVIRAGCEVNLERSIKNNNLNEGNKFKFIERTGAVEAHRGIKLEDGIVRIEFEFEKEYPQMTWTCDSYVSPKWNSSTPHYGITCNNTYSGPMRGRGTSSGVVGSTSASLNNISISATSASVQSFYNDAGITVAGSKSDQKFQTVMGFATDGTKHNIVLKLLGETPDNKPVVKEVTVKHKPKCTTCGRQNKHNAKFCVECGTALEIFA